MSIYTIAWNHKRFSMDPIKAAGSKPTVSLKAKSTPSKVPSRADSRAVPASRQVSTALASPTKHLEKSQTQDFALPSDSNQLKSTIYTSVGMYLVDWLGVANQFVELLPKILTVCMTERTKSPVQNTLTKRFDYICERRIRQLINESPVLLVQLSLTFAFWPLLVRKALISFPIAFLKRVHEEEYFDALSRKRLDSGESLLNDAEKEWGVSRVSYFQTVYLFDYNLLSCFFNRFLRRIFLYSGPPGRIPSY